MRRALALGLAVSALLVAAPAALAVDPDLLTRWHLDGTGASTPDDSGHNLNGTATNGATFVSGGRFGNALDLGNVGDSQIDVADSATLEAPKVTVFAWVKLGSTPNGTHYVVAKGAAGCNGSSYAINTPNGGLAFHIYNGSSAIVSPNASTGVWNGEWHAVAGTFDGATVRLFVDGVQVGSGTPTATAIAYGLTFDDLRIGNYPGSNLCGGGLVFEGLIDEAQIYKRALAADEIAWLSSSSHSQPPSLPPPPVNTAAPTTGASADPHPGDALTANAGSWTGSPSSYQYQWLRCGSSGSSCSDIAGATAAAYSVVAGDVGSTLRVRVRAVNSSGTSPPADSVATSPVTAVPVPLVAKLSVGPNPSCVASETNLDGSASTGAIASYRFTITNPSWTGFALGYQPYTFVVADGTGSKATWVPSWNATSSESLIVVNPFGHHWAVRDEADATLTVTDTRGATAQTTVKVSFVQTRSDEPRTGCPPLSLQAKSAWEVKEAIKTVKTVGNSVSLSVPCASTAACLGTIAVTFSGSLKHASAAAAKKRRKPVVLAAASINVAPGQTKRVVAKLNAKGRKLVRTRKKVRARVRVSAPNAVGKQVTRSRPITLRARRGR